MRIVNLNVKGMHCSSCEVLLKDSLEEFNEIESATVSYKNGTVSVKVRDNKFPDETIKKVIRNEGYEVD